MIEIRDLQKHFGDHHVLRGVSLHVDKGEVVCLIGPSGSGKSTVLRCINGLESYDGGEIRAFGERVDRNSKAIHTLRSRMGMVFQRFNLFPHRSVLENVMEGPVYVKGERPDAARAKAMTLLEKVGLAAKAQAFPNQLSGGQQQRVALARALVNRPRALLLDEPLAALDLKLRQAMQLELKRIQREVGITFIFVTHDQNEALTMSDRLVVMNAGRIEQLGAPREVYERPRTRFVAGFIGTSNILGGRVRELDGDTAVLDTPAGEALIVPDARAAGAQIGQQLEITVRPEKIIITTEPPAPGRCAVRGRINEVVYLGTSTQYAVTASDGSELLVFLQNASDSSDIAERGEDVWLSWRPDHSLALATDAVPAELEVAV